MKMLAWPRLLFTLLVLGLLFGLIACARSAPPTKIVTQAPPLRKITSQRPPRKSYCHCDGPATCTCAPGTCQCPLCNAPVWIEVHCPPAAVITFDGKATRLTGSVRWFETKGVGSYVVLCYDPLSGFRQTRTLRVGPGTTRVDFGGYQQAAIPLVPMMPLGGGFGGGGGGC